MLGLGRGIERSTIRGGVCTWGWACSSSWIMLRGSGLVSPLETCSPPWPSICGRVLLEGPGLIGTKPGVGPKSPS